VTARSGERTAGPVPEQSAGPASRAGRTAGRAAGGSAGRTAERAVEGTAGGTAGPRRSRGAPRVAATALPVARVAVDVPLPHLDRLFDYLVPQSADQDAVAGCRVRVRFSGRLVSGYLVERAEATEHHGKLAFLERVLSPEPVLTPEVAGLARAVADRYGGTLADVLRLAIPPRHAAAEASASPPETPAAQTPAAAAPAAAGPPDPGSWARYPAGPSFLRALADGRAPRAVWSALPGPDWPDEIARAAAAAAASGRGSLIIVPDARDLARMEAALAAALGGEPFASLSAQLGPAERYRRWLSVLRGQVRIVTGTRSAMFAPVERLGLVVIWDDGDDLHAEPRAPYPHARDVLLLRAHRSRAAALVGGFARTAEAAQLIATGWARSLAADRATVREVAPLIRTAGDDSELARDEAARSARMPGLALRIVREALGSGPVLFQVPRRGYLAAVACQHCGARVRCLACGGPVALSGPGQPLRCGWCGHQPERSCSSCGNAGLRAIVTGARRTAEELSRAFPGVPVRTSSGAGVLASVAASPAIVIATPGAEPLAAGGYAAAVLLDPWALLGRPSLRAAEEALRRWMNAAALVSSAPAGGKVVLAADPSLAVVQALIRWDPATHADRELAEREELRFPPAVRIAALTGPETVIADLLEGAKLPQDSDVLGPVPAAVIGQGGQLEHAGPPGPDAGMAGQPGAEIVRFLVRSRSAAGTAMAVALREALAERVARKDAGQVRLQLDPAELI
jgi:primosomal protein N' (replication factor Y) (superfamily II helicase)